MALLKFALEHSGFSLPLSGTFLRRALPDVSEEKVQDLQQEIKPLSTIFSKLQQHSHSIKLPYSFDGILNQDEISLLLQNGLMGLGRRGSSEGYFLSEQVRTGLGYEYESAKRASVISLHKEKLVIWKDRSARSTNIRHRMSPNTPRFFIHRTYHLSYFLRV